MKAIQRIYEYIDYKGIKAIPFEKTIGLSNGYLGKQLKRNADLGESILLKVVENCPDMNPLWLFMGKSPMLLKDIKVNLDNAVSEPVEVYKLRTDRIEEEQSIPLYNVQASAGMVTLFSDSSQQKPVDYITVPNLPKCDGAVYVTGDSMYPLLKNGDIVMYKQIKDFEFGILYGEIYIINMEIDGDDYVSVKWLHKSEKGDDWIKLVSENRHHPDRDIPLRKVRALALVKASIRINSMS